jgi:hypothetical protein
MRERNRSGDTKRMDKQDRVTQLSRMPPSQSTINETMMVAREKGIGYRICVFSGKIFMQTLLKKFQSRTGGVS